MGAVQIKPRRGLLHAPWPAGGPDAAPHSPVVRRDPRSPKDLQGADRQHGVAGLIAGLKGHRQIQIAAVPHPGAHKEACPIVQTAANLKIVLPHRIPGRVQKIGPALDHSGGLGLSVVENHRHPRLDDTGLFRRDGGDGISQILGVIQADGGDHAGQRGLDHIGGVQAAAHAGLQHHHIHLLLPEQHHRHIKQKLKKRGVAFPLLPHTLRHG